jgi:hypothetical protein
VNDDETEEEIPVAETGIAVQREGQRLLSERREIERAPLRKTTHLGASPLKSFKFFFSFERE